MASRGEFLTENLREETAELPGYKDFKARLASIWNNLVPRAHAPLPTTGLENFLPSFSQS